MGPIIAGSTGPQGLVGNKGINGPSPKGALGLQGARGLQGPQGGQGAKGPAGGQGAKGANGPGGPQGARGGAEYSLISSAPGITVTNNANNASYSIQKQGGNGWNEHAYSDRNRGCGNSVTVTFNAQETASYKMIGLNEDPTANTSYSSIDFAWYPAMGGNLNIYQSGASQGSFGTYSTSTRFAITYDHTTGYITYWKDGNVAKEVFFKYGACLFLDSSLYTDGAGFDNIRYFEGVDHAAFVPRGLTGPVGATGDQGPIGNQGAKGATGYKGINGPSPTGLKGYIGNSPTGAKGLSLIHI